MGLDNCSSVECDVRIAVNEVKDFICHFLFT